MAEEVKDYQGFIDLGTDVEDIHEPVAVPTGAYDLEITDAKAIYVTEEESGNRYLGKIQVQIEIKGVENAATLFHNISLPKPGELQAEPKKAKFKIMLAKKFYKLFSVPMSAQGMNTNDLIGAKASQVAVDLRPPYQKNDGTMGAPSNQINMNGIHV